MRFIATTAAKVDSIEIASGNLIFSTDERAIYLDAGTERYAYRTIITLVSDDQRQNLISPVAGYYLVQETSKFYYYDGTNWNIIAGDEVNLYYDSYEDFPDEGAAEILYIDKANHKMYIWDATENVYAEMNSIKWENISE